MPQFKAHYYANLVKRGEAIKPHLELTLARPGEFEQDMATLYLASLLYTVISPHQREMLILSINGGQFPYGLLNRSFFFLL